MINKASKKETRYGKHKRIRKKISGTPDKPRLCVFKSSKNIYAQLIDDENGITLATASTLESDLQEFRGNISVEAAKRVGDSIAEKAKSKGVTKIVFDRNGYIYHGRIAALADAAREKGLEF
ncbi:LSU ribosomal protein L18p (L5e) [Candidatus Syntrophocurvum alkaliphilum]|uniref:Large ribosomal subunit protein uL18 n=1 Tax=Candidatus Syntrophocurvum alkaliphilum TaxID=2293317 RepID=A0A6I6DIZ9_9FIRM|nr:50S ribosomal protein L18 [Candidatus Syntrophocurvum alkaliphilum]QGU00794.1 LSU ribosomal protein L18p (L5e) [Candidatus Syntrophocurvum alkaliphilum]